MLMQFHDFPKYYKNSKLDGALWLLTFIAVIVLDIDSGLVIGIVLAILLLIYRSYTTHVNKSEAGLYLTRGMWLILVYTDLTFILVQVKEIASVPQTELFVHIKESEVVVRPHKAVVFKVTGAVSFANYEDVIERLRKKVKKIPGEEKEVNKSQSFLT